MRNFSVSPPASAYAPSCRNFTGQWLQARDISTIGIDAPAIFLREHPPSPAYNKARATIRRISEIPDVNRTPQDVAALEAARKIRAEVTGKAGPQLTGSLRTAMQEETEMLFAHVLAEDRPLTEIVRSRSVFANEELARHYGLVGETGGELREVDAGPVPRGHLRQPPLTLFTSLPP